MALPGRLSLGFLQEDNPQKFYFRIRPLMIIDEGGNTPVENAIRDYADDGFIRIVPDKNEISHFKVRMRGLGRYCLMDLRKHPNDNDKIRPNKNYAGEVGDRNAFIVYSDVIAKAPPLAAAEIIAADADADPEGLTFAKPGTCYVMLDRGERLEGPYGWEETGEGLARIALAASPAPVGIDRSAAAGALASVDLDEGGAIALLVGLEQFGIAESAQAEPVKPVAPAPAAAAAPIALADPPPAPTALPAPQPAPEPKPEPNAEPASERPAAEAPPAPADEAAKPWLGGAPSFSATRAINGRLNSRMQALQAQSGINPARGRTIQDVVDELWRQSRYDQLGHPVPLGASSRPVVSPLERAGDALREAWALPDLRDRLVNEIRSIDELAQSLEGARAREEARSDGAAEALEAERLRLLSEIDALKKQRQETREQLIGELRKAGNRQLLALDQLIEQKQRQAAEEQLRAERAQAASEAAAQSAGRVYGDALDQQMTDLITSGRARDLVYALSLGTPSPARPIEVHHPSAGELVSDLRVHFESAGLPLTNDEAVNLLAIVALGSIAVLSGPVGSGKSDTARALAGGLGLAGTGRFAELTAGWDGRRLGEQVVCAAPGGMPMTALPDVRRLLEVGDDLTPTMLLVDDANAAPIERYLGELLGVGEPGAPRSLTTGLGSLPLHPQLRLLLTVADAPLGGALTARLLDRAFLIRLALPSAAQPWPSALPPPEPAGRAPSLASLRRAFDDARELPGEVEHRLDGIRRQLGLMGVRLSRRAMVDMRRYLSAALPAMAAGPAEALDLAFAQRALPAILASAELEALQALPEILGDLPRCMALMRQPLPLPPL